MLVFVEKRAGQGPDAALIAHDGPSSLVYHRPASPATRSHVSREHGGEQIGAPNGLELRSTVPNGTAPTGGSHVSVGRRTVPSLVHAQVHFRVRSTDVNCIKAQVNSAERCCYGSSSPVSSSYFPRADPDQLVALRTSATESRTFSASGRTPGESHRGARSSRPAGRSNRNATPPALAATGSSRTRPSIEDQCRPRRYRRRWHRDRIGAD